MLFDIHIYNIYIINIYILYNTYLCFINNSEIVSMLYIKQSESMRHILYKFK